MTPTLRVMLLIDADNVSADVIEQAVQRTMDEYGAIETHCIRVIEDLGRRGIWQAEFPDSQSASL